MKKMSVLLVLFVVMILVVSSGLAEATTSFKPWYPFGLGKLIPEPDDYTAGDAHDSSSDPHYVFMNADDLFIDTIFNMTADEFDAYAKACMNIGFDQDVYYSTGFLMSYDTYGRGITLALVKDHCSVMIDSPLD